LYADAILEIVLDLDDCDEVLMFLEECDIEVSCSVVMKSRNRGEWTAYLYLKSSNVGRQILKLNN
jgi:hypothetical protein